MTPTLDNDGPDDQPPQRMTDSPTAPIPLPRRPYVARLRALRFAMRSPRPSLPASVWPCADDEPCAGTGQLAVWLLTAIVKIVTTYTEPGQRVLLIAPAPGITAPAGSTSTAVAEVGDRSARRPYAGLLEAAWTVVRLGRGIQTHTAAAHPEWLVDTVTDTAPARPSGSESGPGLRPESPSTDHRADGRGESRSGPDTGPPGLGQDGFDLIITAAEPDTLDALAPTAWANLLTQTGILAIITHSESSRGWLADPAASLVRAAHDPGLRVIDRIALLRSSMANVVLAAASSAGRTHGPSPSAPPTSAIRHSSAHDDLFVLARQPLPNGDANGEETSDG